MHDKNHKKPHPPAIEDPLELETDDLPVDPDETLVPTHIPEDPERGRMVDPEDRQPMKAVRRGSWGYAAM
jgi:hypothetical protein